MNIDARATCSPELLRPLRPLIEALHDGAADNLSGAARSRLWLYAIGFWPRHAPCNVVALAEYRRHQ